MTAGNGPIGAVRYAGVRQSMRNGGGPACLRLRVVLNDEERAAVNPAVWLDDGLYDALTAWANRHYRETLAPDDVRDPALVAESRAALDELTGLLRLGPDFYPFQRV
jgi:succinylarginine dihydrolase